MTSIVKKDTAIIPANMEAEIIAIERSMKELKRRQDEIKAGLLEYMTEHGMTCIDTDNIRVTKIEASERETFDTKAFRAENPEDYNLYVRMSPVAPSVRITVR